MTPKEKAIELINKYHSLELIELTKITDGLNIGTTSKQCALIAVDEILNSWYPVNIHCGYEFHHDNLTTSFYEYWKQVKNEIEKL